MAGIVFEASRSKNDEVATSILHHLSATVSHTINNDREYIDETVKTLYDKLPKQSNSGNAITVSFAHGGSAYEGLAVSEDVDADITVLLGKPFEGYNFDVERDETSKYFTLKWRSQDRKPNFCDCDGYVDAAKIRLMMFEGLGVALQNMDIPGAEITMKEGLAAMAVTIKRHEGRTISIDFVPQIVLRSWGQCQDLLPLSEMPPALRKYIDTLNKNKSPTMCFPLAVPKKERYSNGDQLFNISFSLLEKEYFKSNTGVRDMVRLVKFVAYRRDWKEYGFKSYHAKRVAIKNDEKLSKISLWEGFQHLLWCIRDQLDKTGTFDGYFVGEQVTYTKDRPVINKFIMEIDAVLRKSPEEIKRLL